MNSANCRALKHAFIKVCLCIDFFTLIVTNRSVGCMSMVVTSLMNCVVTSLMNCVVSLMYAGNCFIMG